MDLQALLPYIAGAIVLILLILIITIGYVKAPPDTAYIISGLRKKIIVGKASIKIPFLERLDKLSLKLIPIDVKTSSMVPTADYINIQVDAAVNVKVGTDGDKLELAAQNFLNQTPDYMARVAREVLEGNMREIVGRMRLEEMVSDRQKFAELVKENAMPDLAAMGLNIVSFNVQNFTDANGVIDDLGIDNISQIKKKAAIAKAEADKEIAVAKADADRQANDARVIAEREIAIKNNDLAMQKAELKRIADMKQATADAAYQIEKENQRKTIEVTTADADIAKQEREVLLKAKEVEVKEKALEAEVKKQAEAEKFAKQQRADAELYTRQKEAEAKKFEIQQEAEAQKAKADADRYSREREAQGIQLVGEAEAEAIRAKGVAEAEAMDKKAEAYQKYTGAAVAEMLIKVLPDVAGKIAEPLSKIDKITVIGGNEGNAIDPVAGNVPGVMMKLFESMKETTGIDLGEIVKANTYDAKVTRNVNLSGIPNNETNVYVTPEKAKETKPKTIVKPQPLKKEPEKQPEPVKDEKLSWEK
ncbi:MULTISPECIES: flotillin family protein [Bacillota]|jgi:flotillin|uniref:Flotillin family protein n=1 Tax=Amedibacillus hominis TaxID=2897776 RepID=A0ABS9R707_9FIRM|nr:MULTISPECIES: flotillin family protein [Bacillota]MCH4285461.1 flotillin family protein [Amedibacillus hominis]RGB52111.1 flotillin family protein [Absiella sp. AM22-9]RGB58966.1 flotillin family protein [Absiella sp. AM10-20]RGB65355.1 flotillin family protein [Absiella sp. AM09-45]RGB74350.1 flotillin family protein [Absiella sp. AM09-50]